MKIVFLDAATVGADISLSPISSLGELVCFDSSDREESKDRVSDCDVLIVNKIKVDRELIDAAPKLKLICEAATGVNNIDTVYAAEKGIPVRNVAGYSTDSVVQLTFMHILNLLCRCRHFNDYVIGGNYSAGNMFTEVDTPFCELAGKTIGIIGMGAIGSKVAHVAEAFGMDVIYYSTSGTSHCTDYPSVTLCELLERSDVVSIHAPLNDRTANLVGSSELSIMKPTAIIVNMGRGGIVDEKALAEAVDAGVIAGAAADVFTTEPLASDSPLLGVSHKERLSLSPHIGWASTEARERLVAGIAENIRSFIEG